MGTMEWKHVLAATDFGETGNRAVARAAGLARAAGADLSVVHVHEAFAEPNPMLGYYVDTSSPEERAAELARDKSALEALVPAGLAAQSVVEVSDNVAQAICAAAARLGADLVVIGTHGRKGVSRVVMGSVAERVVREAPCSVLVIR
jgi:nucleotide-binding universal stress UspA family protein